MRDPYVAFQLPFWAMRVSLLGLPFLWFLVVCAVVLLVGGVAVRGALKKALD